MLQAMPQIHDLPLEDLQPSQQANTRYEETLESRDDSDNRNRRRELSSKVCSILWSMKLIGAYHGDTTLNEDPQMKPSFFSGCCCTIVLLGQRTLVL